jgi:Asp-tRNA(Asn)/Glu-tRNA(Gln) amidotransferase A subunit family amidase
MNSRRHFLASASASLAATAMAGGVQPQSGAAPAAGTPPAFGTAPPVGPEVSPATFAEAEKLMRVEFSGAEREMAAGNWRAAMAGLAERRCGPRTVRLGESDAPATQWNPASAGGVPAALQERFVGSRDDARPLPARDADIAYAPVAQLARWIQARALSSERLTLIYLDRIARLDRRLRSVITLNRDAALAKARAADREIAAGHYRGPLHGVPYGAKDLLDTAGLNTTWGAEFFRQRKPAADATVIARLDRAGAVLLAKLSLGALALNDIWFNGQTMNPWLPAEGSGGSSAGPAAATAAGLVAFSIGSETGGSIVGPCMRCGVTGLRPTYGRVPRTGAMTLCWSLDKLGPIARSVEDTMLVLQAIHGPDGADSAGVAQPLDFEAGAAVAGLKVGVFPGWMQGAEATDVDRAALDRLAGLGLEPTPVTLPDWPYDSLNLILFAEAAAAFEEMTLDGRMRLLRAQAPDAWPNTLRQSRFLSAVDFVQADRLRRRVALEMARIFGEVDLLLVPSLRDEMLVISNNTGHPSLTLRTGFIEVAQARSDWAPDPKHPLPRFDPPRRVPHGVTLIGRLFDEGLIARVGMALERASGAALEVPPGFT